MSFSIRVCHKAEGNNIPIMKMDDVLWFKRADTYTIIGTDIIPINFKITRITICYIQKNIKEQRRFG